MRKTQVALAAAALVASSVALADVTVSGYVDAGYASQAGAGGKLVGGLVGPNVFNLSGAEDLGNGMKAVFLLQNRFEITGGLTTTGFTYKDANVAIGDGVPYAKVFNQANVGLATEIGTIELGRGVDVLWGNAAGAFDVTGGNNMGSFVGSVITKGASGIFVDNQIKYVSPKFSGLQVAGSYIVQDSLQCAVGPCMKNDYSVAATYSIGGLNVGVGYADRTGTNYSYVGTTQTTTKMSGTATFLGAGYDLGIAKVNVVYLDTKNNGSTTGVNAAAPVPGVAGLTVNAGYYSDTGLTATNGTSTAVGANYALSKRTNVFANYQTTSGKTATFIGLSDPNNPSAAAKSAFTVGIGHSF